MNNQRKEKIVSFIADINNTSRENVNIYLGVLFLSLFVYSTPFITPLLEISLLITIPYVFLLLFVIILYPYALYEDRRFVMNNSEWEPTKLYYIGFIPGPIGLIVVSVYLVKRYHIFKENERP